MFEKIKQILGTRWVIIYTTTNQHAYFQVKGKLGDHHIMHKTAFDASPLNRGREYGRSARSYTILVREEDANQVNNIIHEM